MTPASGSSRCAPPPLRQRSASRVGRAIQVLLAALMTATVPALAQPQTQTQTEASPAASPAPSHTAQSVLVPSFDRLDSGEPVALPGRWFRAHPAGELESAGVGGKPRQAPALVLMHGCGGMYATSKRRPGRLPPLSARFLELAAEFNAAGVHVLVLDSLSPRGEVELCTQKVGSREVTQRERRRDALGALAWLERQPGVDAARLGLMGWSNGASTVLAATNLRHPEVRRAAVRPSIAVAYYPGCSAEATRGYEPSAALLLLLGGADDWTPPGPCEALAQATRARVPAERAPELEVYAGARHGFDGTASVRLRTDVPNGVQPGAGVHVGGDPAARQASRARLREFLHTRWQVPL